MADPLPTLTTCTACGCTCDDLRLTPQDLAVGLTEHACCALGAEWFAQPTSARAAAEIDGIPVPLQEAIAHARQLLQAARHPLVAGLQFTTSEAQRAAVALADQLGAVIDWTASPADASSTLALQTAGGVTATLGEVAQRADMLVVWGSDLATTHPRHFERYSLEPTSPWLPRGRADRKLVVIDDHPTATMELADVAICISKERHYEALSVVCGLVAGIRLDPQQVLTATGLDLAQWQQLALQMQQAKYGAVIAGKALATGEGEPLVALTQLMATLTATTRWVALGEGSPGNPAGAANVLAWQTGSPLGVSFAHGHPTYGPDEWTTAAVLARGETDAVLIVGDDLMATLPTEAAERLAKLPTITLDWRDTPTTTAAKVAIRVARPGVEAAGTTYRTDGIAVPLRAVRSTDLPTTEAVLRMLAG